MGCSGISKKYIYENPDVLTGHIAEMQNTGYRNDLRDIENSSWIQHRALDAHMVEMPWATKRITNTMAALGM